MTTHTSHLAARPISVCALVAVTILATAPARAEGLLDSDAALLRGEPIPIALSAEPGPIPNPPAERRDAVPSFAPAPHESQPPSFAPPAPSAMAEDPAARFRRVAERASQAPPRREGDDPVLRRLQESRQMFERNLKVEPPRMAEAPPEQTALGGDERPPAEARATCKP